jgi:mersacidin/lichenicidin family type 2 lantibiotic
MLGESIIRAWKDPEYRQSLSQEEQALLPENPAGAIELTDEELDMVAGGSWRQSNSNSQSFRPSNSNSNSSSNSYSYRRPSNSNSNSNSNSQSFRPSSSHRPSCSWRCSQSYSYRR